MVASHKDGRQAVLRVTGKSQISKTTFNCSCDNFIAESPFLHFDADQDLCIRLQYSLSPQAPGGDFISSDSFCFGLRGPPPIHS